MLDTKNRLGHAPRTSGAGPRPSDFTPSSRGEGGGALIHRVPRRRAHVHDMDGAPLGRGAQEGKSRAPIGYVGRPAGWPMLSAEASESIRAHEDLLDGMRQRLVQVERQRASWEYEHGEAARLESVRDGAAVMIKPFALVTALVCVFIVGCVLKECYQPAESSTDYWNRVKFHLKQLFMGELSVLFALPVVWQIANYVASSFDASFHRARAGTDAERAALAMQERELPALLSDLQVDSNRAILSAATPLDDELATMVAEWAREGPPRAARTHGS